MIHLEEANCWKKKREKKEKKKKKKQLQPAPLAAPTGHLLANVC
jgi:hypothetical protein